MDENLHKNHTSFIGIISAKGGVGKTTTAINLSAALNGFGRGVVLVDGNYTKPNIGLMLGITKVHSTLHHTLRGEEHISNSVYVHPCGLQVIPGSIIYEDLHKNSIHKLEDVLLKLKGKTEVVIIDCGPGISSETMDVMDIADSVILVTTPDLSSVTDTLRTKRLCKDRGIRILGIVVTHHKEAEYNIQLSDIESVIEEPVIGNIPYDEAIKISQHKKYPVLFTDETCPSSIAYKKIAANLIGETYEPEIKESVADYVLKKLGFK